MKVLLNAFGIQDSGGLTVLKKILNEIVENEQYHFFIFLFENSNTQVLFSSFQKHNNLEFIFVKNKGLIYRVLFENIYYFYFTKKKNIDLVYNFSGSAQFLSRSKQLVKVHNLLFYSKRLDRVYLENKEYKSWIKHIFIKRLFFKLMLKRTRNIEIQSTHVKENLKNFLNISKKNFFLKNDFNSDVKSIEPSKEYDFSKKMTFLYIVGPHFNLPHKNIKDFIAAMMILNQNNIDFEIKITLSKEVLEESGLWQSELNDRTIFLGYIPKEELEKQFQNNTILISTSIIETLGLHVIEATLHGVAVIVPRENYSKSVYGNDVLFYELFDIDSLIMTINKMTLLSNNEIIDIIDKNQRYLMKNKTTKYDSILSIFDKILKGC